jgi:hypothetical protein
MDLEKEFPQKMVERLLKAAERKEEKKLQNNRVWILKKY